MTTPPNAHALARLDTADPATDPVTGPGAEIGSPVAERRDARSRATVQRLLDATVESLIEVGYARTSTQEVCRRAGTPRGTLLHHFGTRAELVVAALDHVLNARLAEFREAFRETPIREADDRVGAVVERLWPMLTGPAFYAWLELTVAARTDDALREPLARVMSVFEARTHEVFLDLFPESGELDPVPGLSSFASLAPSFAFATLNGLAVDHIYRDPSELEPVKQALTTLGRLMLPQR